MLVLNDGFRTTTQVAASHTLQGTTETAYRHYAVSEAQYSYAVREWEGREMMNRQWKVLARHKWVGQCTITESCKVDDSNYRRFTATIFGYRNWKIWQGQMTNMPHVVATIMAKVQAIKSRIAADDESVFTDKEVQAW